MDAATVHSPTVRLSLQYLLHVISMILRFIDFSLTNWSSMLLNQFVATTEAIFLDEKYKDNV